jgi:opacity protein-like surface antigen
MGKVVSSKVAKVLIMAAVLLAVAAAAVVAQSASSPSTPSAMGSSGTTSKQCYTVPCHGSASRETIYERIGNRKRDVIRGYGNNDRLHANTYSNDIDRVSASGGGTNYLFVNDGDTLDTAVGAQGQFITSAYYKCYVDSKAEAGRGCARVIVR